MNIPKAAAALNTASLALAELAEALLESEAGEREVRLGANPTATTPPPAAPAGAAIPPAPPELSPFEDESATWTAPENLNVAGTAEPQGSLTNCPKHHSAYLPSKFKEGAFYCPADSDDPAWRNTKGKCRITPANAAEWLRVTAAA